MFLTKVFRLCSTRQLPFTLILLASLTSLVGMGCSKKGSVIHPDITDKTGKIVSKVDSLVNANKGTGKGVVTGVLTGEGSKVSNGILKQAANAGGEFRFLTTDEVPLTGANVMIFNALKPTTVADTVVKTDSTGRYIVLLPAGQYFGFVVYLNLKTFQMVTTSLPNMRAVADTSFKMDTTTAVEDVTPPMVTTVYDASSPNSDNLFLLGAVPDAAAHINISFSEPMNRESAKGIVLGRIDTTNTSTLTLRDTVSGVQMTWSGDSKVMTLNVSALTAGEQYGILIPTTLKDLAKNPLEKAFKALFVASKAADLALITFNLVATSPLKGDTLKPNQNPSITFNRPADGFSVMKFAKLSPTMVGFWEVSGNRATFIHKDPLTVGTIYTLSLPKTITDLSGQGLASDTAFSFTVKNYDGAVLTKTGTARDVALAVEKMFNAYLQGDLGRFGASFHTNFRMVTGSEIKSKTQFLDNIREDVGRKMAEASGFLAPVLDMDTTACAKNIWRWKVAPEGVIGDTLWVQSYVSPGTTPQVWDLTRKEIPRTDLKWDPTGPRFTYKDKKYGFAPDFSKYAGTVDLDAAKHDDKFMGDVMKQTSTIVLEIVKVEGKETFLVDSGMTLVKDTARLAVKMVNYHKMNRTNFHSGRCNEPLEGTDYEILKFQLILDGGQWLVLNIIAPDKSLNLDDFNKVVTVGTSDFGLKVLPITLLSPVNGKDRMGDSLGQVRFRWQGLMHDSVGGYIVGMAEDPRFCGARAPYGTLLFVRAGAKGVEVSFTLNSSAQVLGTNASTILRRVQDLRLPGWEKALFENSLVKLVDSAKGFAGVYNWKAIAVRDTSAAQFLANGFKPERFFGESDFGPARGVFAVRAYPQGTAFNTFDNQVNNTGTGTFNDVDADGFPDAIEMKYQTDARDKNVFPDFKVDTDGDRMADFLEKKIDSTGRDSLIYKKADAVQMASQIQALKAKGIVIEDMDGDGFPNDIEQMLGFNPNDPLSNPGTRPKGDVPLGVFAGKLNMGGTLHTLGFKTYKDTTGNLFAAYSALIGKDTLKDTVRGAFNEGMNELKFQIILAMNGPDSGKSLWFRGYYDPMRQFIMGPCDIGPSAPRNSTMMNGGPLVGQWAASSRGEDVTSFLNTGNNNNNNIGTTTFQYRLPPAGVTEGSRFEFTSKGSLIVINEVGDTLAVADTVNFRTMPDRWEFNSMIFKSIPNGSKKIDLGGVLAKVNGSFILDGHIFTQYDSGTIHKGIPGQFCAKAASTELTLGGTPDKLTVSGKLSGWIQQDKLGTGLVGGDFGKPYMGGVSRFTTDIGGLGYQLGDTIYMASGPMMASMVYVATAVQAAKWPWCNQVLLSGKMMTPKSFANPDDSMRFIMTNQKLAAGDAFMVVLEDNTRPGQLAVLDKVLDPNGVVHNRVLGIEIRFRDAIYGTNGGTCNIGNNNGTVFYRGTATTLNSVLSASDSIILMKDSVNEEGRFTVSVSSLRYDAASLHWVMTLKPDTSRKVAVLGDPMDANKPLIRNGRIVCLGEKSNIGVSIALYRGPQTPLLTELIRNDTLVLMKDSVNEEGRFVVNKNSLKQEAASQIWYAQILPDTMRTVAFVSDPTDPNRLRSRNGLLMAMNFTPKTGSGLVMYHGSNTLLIAELAKKDTVLLMRDNFNEEGKFAILPFSLSLDPASQNWYVRLQSDTMRVVAFAADPMDPTKLAMRYGLLVTLNFFLKNNNGPILYKGPVTLLRDALSKNDTLILMKDSITEEGRFVVDLMSLRSDATSGIVFANLKTDTTRQVAFVAEGMDENKLAFNQGKLMGINFRINTGGNPIAFKGTATTITIALQASGNTAMLIPTSGGTPTGVQLNITTLTFDGKYHLIQDANDPTQIYTFIGESAADPTRLRLSPLGVPEVMAKPLFAAR